jgi:hypothetical protein
VTKVSFPEVSALFAGGAALASGRGEHHVFRAVLLSIVVSVAIGQNAALLCTAWCHDATSAPCPHEASTTSSSVQADDRCEDAAAGVVAFVREDAPRVPAAPDAQNAPGVPRVRPALPSADLTFGFAPGRRLLEERPLITSLRI